MLGSQIYDYLPGAASGVVASGVVASGDAATTFSFSSFSGCSSGCSVFSVSAFSSLVTSVVWTGVGEGEGLGVLI